jgi:hypothetical protein
MTRTARTSIKLNKSNSSQGFTLMETTLAIAIATIILSGIMAVAVRTVKNGTFAEKLTDTNVLLSQKTSELFNNAVGEVAKIPKDEITAGSIDPNQPINGYFDITNESGCVIKGGAKVNVTSSIGKPGDLGGDTGDLGDLGNESGLNCSTSTLGNPSQSLIPKFRRQWIVTKDFPSDGDISFSVVIVAIQTNQITSSTVITKSDGFASK